MGFALGMVFGIAIGLVGAVIGMAEVNEDTHMIREEIRSAYSAYMDGYVQGSKDSQRKGL